MQFYLVVSLWPNQKLTSIAQLRDGNLISAIFGWLKLLIYMSPPIVHFTTHVFLSFQNVNSLQISGIVTCAMTLLLLPSYVLCMCICDLAVNYILRSVHSPFPEQLVLPQSNTSQEGPDQNS